MPEPDSNLGSLAGDSKRFLRRVLITGGNRVELLMVELEEERLHLLDAFLVALGLAAFGLLAGMTLTVGVVVCFWSCSPLGALLAMTCLHSLGALWLGRRLKGLLRGWRSLPCSLDQLRKDRACLEKGAL